MVPLAVFKVTLDLCDVVFELSRANFLLEHFVNLARSPLRDFW